ncbi:dTDP-4-dehydrorhamnose 3,5-epimerase family protein [Nocardiopsis sp. MG754419]|uniref:dTDP-4-dehydrorhamnose 3,5-epimerase family protein n=1 Tax=Nocardiopsis sp. MG754419 TaxID=2259865 RepID=UPI001BA8B11C|nr:dTDP-4-dehydrorhamnose 3,5-epimerase family protein [Nocardiopsis sp. MG754419]MBR8743447.1 dTDP-4-keto-6-deoxy-D-glucose epimerase [Nocardiopsis sp. MG754419]
MKARALGIIGAHEFTPTVFPDRRGLFVAPFQGDVFAEQTGFRHFPLAQTGHSVSRRGVVRGVHYTDAPPGMATYVYCPRGRVTDFIVDLRTGSPTFGRVESTVLDPEDFRAVYVPVGVGHGYVAHEDDTVVSYLLSGGYAPEHEKAVSLFDPELDLPLPAEEPILSDRDRVAPTLREAAAAGGLPDYEVCRELERRTLG